MGKITEKKAKRGHPSPWTAEQDDIIESYIPEWHKFGMVTHREIDTNNSIFTKWKKIKVDEIAAMKEFKHLPKNVRIQTPIHAKGRWTNFTIDGRHEGKEEPHEEILKLSTQATRERRCQLQPRGHRRR